MSQSELKAITLSVIVIILLCAGTAFSQIILGESCAISGPVSFLGTEMSRGANAYFKKYANEITLKTSDDTYEPDKCIENTKKFIEDGVTALFGYVGTPTSKAALPLAKEKNMLFFGPLTGAGFLSDSKNNPYSFVVRESYDVEIENIVKHLKEDLGITRISLFVQKDSFGLAGVAGAVKAVRKIGGIEIIPPAPEIPEDSAPKNIWDKFWDTIPNYPRNTVAIGRSARQIMGNRPEAVIMVGTYRACAEAINLWKRLGFDAVFANISFVGSIPLAEACKNNIKNVLISQVVPDPWDANIPIVKEYQDALGDKKYSFVSLEGYITAKIIHKAIAETAPPINSENIKKSLEKMSVYDIGGLTVSFGPDDRRGLNTVYLTKVEAIPKGEGNFDYKFIYVDKLAKE